jgi:hypothetical protein
LGEYEERYVAYIDILGFRSLIDQLDSGRMSPSHLRDVLKMVHEHPSFRVNWAESSDFRARSISDAVALSAAPRPEGFEHLVFAISELATNLLSYGYLIRGAITKGKLWHDDEVIFGPGLVRAYDMEARIARYPRIIVTLDVATEVERYVHANPSAWSSKVFRNILLQADDGPMYLHILLEMIRELLAQYRSFPDGTVFARERFFQNVLVMRNNLQDAFDSSIDDPKIFEKVQWFAAYWNRKMPSGIPGLEPVVGPAIAPKAFQ